MLKARNTNTTSLKDVSLSSQNKLSWPSTTSFKFSARNYRNLDPIKRTATTNALITITKTTKSNKTTTDNKYDVKSKLISSVKDLRKSLKSLLIIEPNSLNPQVADVQVTNDLNIFNSTDTNHIRLLISIFHSYYQKLIK